MEAPIPESIKETKTSRYLAAMGLNRIYQGKTRDMYDLGDHILVIASDRLSIYKFVMNALVSDKGEILTAQAHFWLTKVLKNFPHHLVNSEKFDNRNAACDLIRKYPGLPLMNSLVVKKVRIIPWELIFRNHIGGSVYKEYLATGKAGGNLLKPNLPKWSKLKNPIFTPSSKVQAGKDINRKTSEFFSQYGRRGISYINLLEKAIRTACAYAERKGILILDTKLEGDLNLIADEVLTPDSTRFCDYDDWVNSMSAGKEPDFLDIQVARNWGQTLKTPFEKGGGSEETIIGLNRLKPANKNHFGWVHHLKVPDEVIAETSKRYHQIFERLTGMTLGEYQRRFMLIPK